jgi:hypothetical protein
VSAIGARRLAVAALASLATAAAFAQQKPQQPQPRDLFKGKVKEGLYEVRSDADLSGVPGIPKEAAKRSETRQRCLTRQDVERGVEAGKECEVKSYKPSATAASVVMQCKDGSVTDMKFAFGSGTFSSEARTSGEQDGKAFVSVFRSEAKHIGPCPQPQPQGAPAPKK